MAKYLVGIAIGDTPTYDASQKILTFDEATFKDKYTSSPIEFIINNSTNNLIYKDGITGKGGTWDSSNHTLTLEFDTTADGSADTDSLTIWADIKDGKRGVDFLSQMYVEGIANAQNDDVEARLADLSVEIESMSTDLSDDLTTLTTDSNTRLDKLAEIPDSIIVETGVGGDGKEVQIIENVVTGIKEVHVVDFGQAAIAGAGTLVAYSDLIVAVKGIGLETVDIKIDEGAQNKVPKFPLAQADNIDARGDKLSVDYDAPSAAVGGKVQVTLVKE